MPFEDILAYDNKCFISANFPARRTFLKQWIAVPGGATYVALNSEGHVVGMGCRRVCVEQGHHMVGPLYADNPEIAEILLQKLCSEVAGCNVTIHIW